MLGQRTEGRSALKFHSCVTSCSPWEGTLHVFGLEFDEAGSHPCLSSWLAPAEAFIKGTDTVSITTVTAAHTANPLWLYIQTRAAFLTRIGRHLWIVVKCWCMQWNINIWQHTHARAPQAHALSLPDVLFSHLLLFNPSYHLLSVLCTCSLPPLISFPPRSSHLLTCSVNLLAHLSVGV